MNHKLTEQQTKINCIEIAAARAKERLRRKIRIMCDVEPENKGYWFNFQWRIIEIFESERISQRKKLRSDLARDYDTELKNIFITNKQIEFAL